MISTMLRRAIVDSDSPCVIISHYSIEKSMSLRKNQDPPRHPPFSLPLSTRRHFPLEPIFQYLSTGGDL